VFSEVFALKIRGEHIVILEEISETVPRLEEISKVSPQGNDHGTLKIIYNIMGCSMIF
jgi:hypothetical protein